MEALLVVVVAKAAGARAFFVCSPSPCRALLVLGPLTLVLRGVTPPIPVERSLLPDDVEADGFGAVATELVWETDDGVRAAGAMLPLPRDKASRAMGCCCRRRCDADEAGLFADDDDIPPPAI